MTQPAAPGTLAIHVAFFNNTTDTRPKRRVVTWSELVKSLTRHRERPDKDGPLWSPTQYPPDVFRCNDGVESVTMAVGDYDTGASWEDVRPRFDAYEYVVHSTYRYDPDKPGRFRVVIPLTRPIPRAEWPKYKRLLDRHIFGPNGDPADTDASRMYYLPSSPPGALRFAMHHPGAPLDPDCLAPIGQNNGHRSEREIPPRAKQPGDFPPAHIEPIVTGCAWMRDCRDRAAGLSEGDWYAMLSILARVENGETLAHEWSAPYPDYRPAETDKKLAHALEDAGPRTCRSIRESLDAERFCRECAAWGLATSPINLGTVGTDAEKAHTATEKARDAADRIRELIERATESKDVGLVYEAAPILADLAVADYARVRLQLKELFPQGLNLNTLDHEVAAARPTTSEGEIGLVKRLADAIHEEDHFAVDVGGRMYAYTSGVYVPGGERHIGRRVKRLTEDWGITKSWSSHLAQEVAIYISTDAPALWDRPPRDVINLENGLLNVVTRELRPHSPEHLSPIRIPVRYDDTATCHAWEKFMAEVLPEDTQELAWEQAALLMTPDTSIQKAALLLGEGANGKSTYLRAFTAFIGPANIAAASLHKLESDKFAVARLVGKLANICPDIPSAHLAGTSSFKSLTGGDRVQAEFKYRDSFEFAPYARLLFSANRPPKSGDDSDGFFRRWLVVPFTRTFEGGNAVPQAVMDARLPSPSELSGVLNKALAVLPRVRERGITETASMKAAWYEFRQTTDPLAVWLNEHTLEGPGAIVPKQDLRRAYNRACEATDRLSPSETAFSLAIKRLRPDIQSGQRTIAQKVTWCWLGIGLKTPGANPPRDGSQPSQGSQGSSIVVNSARTLPFEGGEEREEGTREGGTPEITIVEPCEPCEGCESAGRFEVPTVVEILAAPAVDPAAVLAQAEAAGWPRVQLRRGDAVLPGEVNWRRFIHHATQEDLARARGALNLPAAQSGCSEVRD